MTRRWSAILSFFVIMGCKPKASPPDTYEIPPRTTVELQDRPQVPIRILYRGKVLRTFAWSQETLERCPHLDGILEADFLVCEALMPEGWQRIGRGRKGGQGIIVSFDKTAEADLLIDNRGGAAAKISYGQLSFDAAADSTAVLTIPDTGGTADWNVLLNGKEIGKMSRFPSAKRGVGLVDTSGLRTYRWRSVVYSNTPPELRNYRLPDTEEFFRKKGFHRFPYAVDFFLKPAPSSIELRMRDPEYRGVLEEVKP